MKRVLDCLAAAMLASVAPWPAAAERASVPGAPEADTEPFVEKEQLFSQLDAMTDGTQVWLRDVIVREKSGNVLRIGARHHELFVVPEDPSSLDFLKVGAHVDVRGTLRKTAGAAQAKLMYGMSRRAARRFSFDRYYVAGASLAPAS